MNLKDLINLIDLGQNIKASEKVKDVLYQKSGELLADYKKEVAQTYFDQY